MRDIRESDWKHFRKLHPVLLDRYCKQVLQEVENICLEAERSSHQRYLDLYKLMKRRDKELGNLFDDPKRSTATLQIMQIRKHGLFTEDEFSQFSQDMQDVALRFSG